MPTYEYGCPTCGTVKELFHSIKEDPVITCDKCIKDDKPVQMERLISHNIGGFIMKGGTETTAWKEKRHRVKKNADLEVRQMERYGGGSKLQPNVGGVPTESWSDASKLAKECGMNADTYKPLVEKEKKTSKISGIDDNRWKAVKAKKENV